MFYDDEMINKIIIFRILESWTSFVVVGGETVKIRVKKRTTTQQHTAQQQQIHLQRHQLQKQTAESVPRNDEEQTKVETLKKQFTPKQLQTKFSWKPMGIIFSIFYSKTQNAK